MTEKETPTAEEIADRIGSKAPTVPAPEEEAEKEAALEDGEDSSDEGEESEDADDTGSDDGDEEDEDDDDAAEDDSEEEDDDADDDATRSNKSQKTQRTVPYATLKAERGKVKELRKQIADLVKSTADARANRKGTDVEDEQADLEATAKQLGEDLGQDADGLKKVLKAAVDLARKEFGTNIPKDVADKLKLLDTLQVKEKEAQETAHFEKEWGGTLPTLKKQFPNASESMLAEAKKKMDDLAHSKKYHSYDLDYILFKEAKSFDALLKVAPGKRSGESGKRIQDATDEEQGAVDSVAIEDMTPAIMRQREQANIAERRSSKDVDLQIMDPLK